MRQEGWDARLLAVVEAEAARRFAWGEADCMTFVAACVAAVTGEDILRDWRGWVGERSARARLVRRGYARLADVVAAHFAVIPVARAGRGDLVYPAKVDALMAPAVIVGGEAVARGVDGLVMIERSAWCTAYRVG